ncbi:MAG: glycosyltransferase [Flavobacteriales bacterium]
MSVKVCHISTAHPPFDVRIFHKECVSLAQSGYDVSLVVTHDKKEIVKGVNIIPLPVSKGRLHRMFIKTHFAFYRSLKTKSKIFHFHDPELMLVGILLKILGKKVIFDSHENVSSQIESKHWIGSSFLRKSVKSVYRIFEKFSILFFNSVISVTPEIVEFLSSKKGVLVRNYPIISLIDKVKGVKNKSKKTTLIYVGGLTKIRGIKEICQAINQLEQEVELRLVGPWESEDFKNECLKTSNKINYFGVKPLEEVYPLINSSDIGFVTLFPEKNYLNSLPIKAFEYMACEIPMIMSDFPYWKNTFEGCAEFVNPQSVEEIKKAVSVLIEDKDKANAFAIKGRNKVKSEFSWESESEKLINLYKKLEK